MYKALLYFQDHINKKSLSFLNTLLYILLPILSYYLDSI